MRELDEKTAKVFQGAIAIEETRMSMKKCGGWLWKSFGRGFEFWFWEGTGRNRKVNGFYFTFMHVILNAIAQLGYLLCLMYTQTRN